MMKHIIYIYIQISSLLIFGIVHPDVFGWRLHNSQVPGDYPDPGANKIGDHFYLVATGGGPKGENLGGLFALICYT